MKSIIDDTDAIAARLKDIKGASVPEPTPAQESSSSHVAPATSVSGKITAQKSGSGFSRAFVPEPTPAQESSSSHVAHQYDPDLMVYGWMDESDPA